jgi:hypothetical protein
LGPQVREQAFKFFVFPHGALLAIHHAHVGVFCPFVVLFNNVDQLEKQGKGARRLDGGVEAEVLDNL